MSKPSGKAQFEGALRIVEREMEDLLKSKEWDSDSDECLRQCKELLDQISEIWNDVEGWEAVEK